MRDAERSLRGSWSTRQFADAQRSDAALQPSACPGKMSSKAASRCSLVSAPALPPDPIANSIPHTVNGYEEAGTAGGCACCSETCYRPAAAVVDWQRVT